MQPKKCYVLYRDDLPISVHDIKTFTTQDEYDAFLKTCKNNQDILKKKESEYLSKLEQEKEKNKRLENKYVRLLAYLFFEREIDSGNVVIAESQEQKLLNDILNGNDNEFPREYKAILEKVSK